MLVTFKKEEAPRKNNERLNKQKYEYYQERFNKINIGKQAPKIAFGFLARVNLCRHRKELDGNTCSLASEKCKNSGFTSLERLNFKEPASKKRTKPQKTRKRKQNT